MKLYKPAYKLQSKDGITIINTAYHEAGHAVAAVVQGLPFYEVSISFNDEINSLGHVRHPSILMIEASGKREQKQVARQSIIACFAGLQAELMKFPDAEEWRAEEDESNAFEISRDYGIIPRYSSYVGDEYHLDYLHKLKLESRRLIKRHWQSVITIADTLLEQKKLSGNEVVKIVNKNV